MTRRPEAFRFRARHPTFENLFLRRVAEALAAAPPGSGLLVERVPSRPHLILAAAPTFAPAVARAALGLPARLEPFDRGPAGGSSVPAQCGFLVAARTTQPPVDRTEPSPSAGPTVGSSLVFGRAPDVAVQSHWFPDGGGRLRVWTRAACRSGVGGGFAPALDLARRMSLASGAPVQLVARNVRPWERREWADGALHRLRAGPVPVVPAAAAPSSVPESSVPAGGPSAAGPLATVVIGASGSGKTAHLARVAAFWIERGHPAVVLDVHGDLAPAITARLTTEARTRIVAVDASEPPDRIAGIDVLGSGSEAERDGDLVAALKRLSADGTDVYWGFRIERILEAFVRLAREEGGSLIDLAALLTDERRREAARRSTRRPELARFLDELTVLLRRFPDYLQAAAARVARVLADARLAALLAPRDGGIPVGALLADRRAILVRLPFGVLGPEATEYAASLLATRLYLTLVRIGRSRELPARAWFIADEAHLLAPRLMAEALADGRKFGIVTVIASQYPDRLAPELRAAAAGAAGAHLVFRVPPASARAAGVWLGLERAESEALLPALPVGVGVRTRSGERPTLFEGRPMDSDPTAWRFAVDRAAKSWGSIPEASSDGAELDQALWSIYESEMGGTFPVPEEVDRAATGSEAAQRTETLARRGWVDRSSDRLRVTDAGRAYLGVGRATGAVSESAEHRSLVHAAQRIFARHGERLEVIRQGRFDTRLPDGLLRILPELPESRTPAALLERLESRRSSWAWRCFGGRDVHVEAEVSGADRPDRIRRGLAKGRARDAYVVFVVGDPRRARKVRDVLRRSGATRRAAQVWTIPRTSRGPKEHEPEGAGGRI